MWLQNTTTNATVQIQNSQLPPDSTCIGKKLRPFLLFDLCFCPNLSLLQTKGISFFRY